jgi:hypothetical protein
MATRGTKTIDNLGIEVYRRYDDDQAGLEANYAADSKQVATRSTLDVFLPIHEGELSSLLELSEKAHPWASLTLPDKYNEQTKRLFINQLTPAMGPQDKLELQETKIEEIQQESGEKYTTKEEAYESEEIALQAKKLLDLLQDIRVLNKIIADVNAERYRYNKG